MPPGGNPLDNPLYGYTKTGIGLPDGRGVSYYGIDVGDCAHVVALEEDLTTYFVTQHRPNLLRSGMSDVPSTLELPGGFVRHLKIDTEKNHAEAARLEAIQYAARSDLHAEIGRHAGTMAFIGTILPSPGVSNERDHIFIARELEVLGDAAVAEDIETTVTDMRVVRMPFGKAYDLLRSGKLPVVGQTLSALSMVEMQL